MNYEFIQYKCEHKIATLTLNRPEKCNAMHGPMLAEIHHVLEQLETQQVRVLILNALGAHFCAGGDIQWMQKIAQAGEKENIEDAQLLAKVLYRLSSCSIPTLALAQGKTMGGGLGLIAACDLALATPDAVFAFPEVKLGIIPAVISPYVVKAIGLRQAQYYFLTGVSFNAEAALRMHLIHQICTEVSLLSKAEELCAQLLHNAPAALSAVKSLLTSVSNEKITESLADKTALLLAKIRSSTEAQEGLIAFQHKRLASWQI